MTWNETPSSAHLCNRIAYIRIIVPEDSSNCIVLSFGLQSQYPVRSKALWRDAILAELTDFDSGLN